jgi:hypothetical protein
VTAHGQILLALDTSIAHTRASTRARAIHKLVARWIERIARVNIELTHC